MPIFIGPQSSYQVPRRALSGPHRALSGPMFAAPLQNGDQGVAQTISKMRQLVDQALRDPSIIRLATDIVRSVPAHDEMAEAVAIYQWVLSHIRFTKDPVNKEKLYPPSELLKIRAGDCDDISMLMSTLLMAIGYPARLITVGANAEDPQQFSHVYVETNVGGTWIPMDAARPDATFGFEPPVYYRKRAWSLTDDTFQDLSGARSTLGNYPRFRSLGGLQVQPAPALGAGRVRTMGLGQDATSSFIATIPQDIAAIANAIRGNPVDPYASFQTAYTPGAYQPAAGYPRQASPGPSPILLIALAAGALLLLGGK